MPPATSGVWTCSTPRSASPRAPLVGTATTAGGLLALGTVLAIAEHDPAQIIGPVMFTIDMIRWAVIIVSVVWGPAVFLAPRGWPSSSCGTPAGAGRPPRSGRCRPSQRSTDGEPITPSIVVTAVRDLGIAALRGAIRAMEDNGASMLGPIRIAGCGVEVDVTLPSGVSAPRKSRGAAASSRRTWDATSTRCSSPSPSPPARCGCGSPTPARWTSRSARPR